jgi:hypothetical protein
MKNYPNAVIRYEKLKTPKNGRNKGLRTILATWAGGGGAYIKITRKPLEAFYKAVCATAKRKRRFFRKENFGISNR